MGGNRGTLRLFYYTINELNSISKLPTVTKYLLPLLSVIRAKTFVILLRNISN